MMRRPYALAYLFAGLVVGLFYVGVLFLISKPVGMSPEYRAFFIDRELRNWPGAGGLTYALGTPVDFSLSPPFVDIGWARSESWGAWTAAPSASLLLYPEGRAETGYRVTLDLKRAYVRGSTKQQKVNVIVGGNAVYEAILGRDGPTTLVFDIPASDLSESGALRIQFMLPDCRVPADHGESADTRCLGMGVSRLVIDAVEAG